MTAASPPGGRMICDRLVKSFGSFRALDGISFEATEGSLVGLLGANGAGKTTLFRVLAGFFQPDSGRVSYPGGVTGPAVAYLPESNPLYPDLRVSEYLAFRGGLKGLHGSGLARALDRVGELCDLVGMTREPIFALSRGMRQRVGLADALLADPRVLLLDETSAGLDYSQAARFRRILADLRSHRIILMSSHILREVEACCDRILVLQGGRLVQDTPLAGALRQEDRVEVETEGNPTDFIRSVEQLPGLGSLDREAIPGGIRLLLKLEKADLEATQKIGRLAARQGVVLRHLCFSPFSLERTVAGHFEKAPAEAAP